jgi:hypothetical protein
MGLSFHHEKYQAFKPWLKSLKTWKEWMYNQQGVMLSNGDLTIISWTS